MNPRFIVHHPRRLVYAELPKCASTTMHKLFLNVSGIHTDLEPHYGIWRDSLVDARRAAGLEAFEIEDHALDTFVHRHRGYRFFTVVRNPYSRCLSGYGQQVRRYAKRFRRLAFARAKLRQMLSRKRLGDADTPHRVVTETLQRTISLDAFLEGLRRHGTAFDKHFDLQSNVIRLGRIPYDKLVPMENLADGLRDLFAERNDLVSIPAFNVTRSGQACDQLTHDLKQQIYELYEPDFRKLGYAA